MIEKNYCLEKNGLGCSDLFLTSEQDMDIAFILKKLSLKIAEYQPAFVYTEENKGYNNEQ